MKKVGFIGAGNMAEAIVLGMDKVSFLQPEQIALCDISAERLGYFADMGHATFLNPCDCAAFSDYLFLAIKPQQIDQVLTEIAPAVKEGCVVVSIAAGITSGHIRTLLGKPDQIVVPVMPNTPLLIAQGAVAVGTSEHTPKQALDFVSDIFSSSGKVWLIEESKLNQIIPANGSSPAFIYYYAKLFCDTLNQAYGLDKTLVKEMFCQTLIGAANMMLAPGADIDDLISKVCSKGGSTIAGIEGFEEKGLPQAVEYGIQKCVERAEKLGQR